MTKTNRRAFLKAGFGALALPMAARTANAASHAVHVVEIKRNKFTPATLEMQAGDSVQFVNLDGAPHTATADNGSFDTGRLRRNEDATVKITDAGEHTYFCEVHPSMKGVIVAS